MGVQPEAEGTMPAAKAAERSRGRVGVGSAVKQIVCETAEEARSRNRRLFFRNVARSVAEREERWSVNIFTYPTETSSSYLYCIIARA